MSYEMNERIKNQIQEIIDSMNCQDEPPYAWTNDLMIMSVTRAFVDNLYYYAIKLCYEIFQRYGYSANEFIKRIEEERTRQEKLHPYNEKTNYSLIALEELCEIAKAYNDLDENGMIDELIQFVAVIVRIMEIEDMW